MLTIYCTKPIPLTADELRDIAPGATVAVDANGKARLTWPGCTLEINPMPPAEVDGHLRGLVGFLTVHGTTESLLERARAVKQVFGIVLADEVEDASPIWELVEGLANPRRGFVFAPDGLFDVDGTPLLPFDLALDDDDDASDPSDSWDDDDDDDDDDDGWDSEPPSAERVAKRALALAAVVLRAHLETGEEFSDPKAQHHLLIAWLAQHGIVDELEPYERAFIELPVGKASQRQVIESSWRAEGLAVLAWALGLAEIPAHDTLSDPADLADRLGLMADDAPDILVSPRVVPAERLSAQQDRLLGLHWRLVDYRVNPRSMNFAEFAEDCWFGSFSLEGVALAKNDLAIEGVPIHDASSQAISRTESIALERHLAINWLLGWDPVYSDVDTST